MEGWLRNLLEQMEEDNVVPDGDHEYVRHGGRSEDQRSGEYGLEQPVERDVRPMEVKGLFAEEEVDSWLKYPPDSSPGNLFGDLFKSDPPADAGLPLPLSAAEKIRASPEASPGGRDSARLSNMVMADNIMGAGGGSMGGRSEVAVVMSAVGSAEKKPETSAEAADRKGKAKVIDDGEDRKGKAKMIDEGEDRKGKANVVDDGEDQNRKFEGKNGGSPPAKRARAAQVRNETEKRRRDNINDKMQILQKMVPNCTKADKASLLEKVAECIKSLRVQVKLLMQMYMNRMSAHMTHPGMPPYMPGFPMEMGMNPAMEFPYMLPGPAKPNPDTASQVVPSFSPGPSYPSKGDPSSNPEQP